MNYCWSFFCFGDWVSLRDICLSPTRNLPACSSLVLDCRHTKTTTTPSFCPLFLLTQVWKFHKGNSFLKNIHRWIYLSWNVSPQLRLSSTCSLSALGSVADPSRTDILHMLILVLKSIFYIAYKWHLSHYIYNKLKYINPDLSFSILGKCVQFKIRASD